MVIWVALIFPIIMTGILGWLFHRKLAWWELLIMILAPALLIAISKAVIETSQTADTEYWGGHVIRAEYYEDWNERVSCRHPIYEDETYTDSDGKTHTRTVFKGYEHAYDVDYHPPYWQAKTTLGDVGIDSGTFDRLCNKFGNKSFVELNRSYHSDDGDLYVGDYKGEPEKIEPATVSHTYENRVQASRSVFNFREVDPKTTPVIEYPKITGYYDQRCVLGEAGATTGIGEQKLAFWNAKLGSTKQVRMLVMVWKNQPMQVAVDQEAHWNGGNKNELVTCIGVNDACEVQWCYVFSWTEVEILKIEARQKVMEQKTLDLGVYVDWLGPVVADKWVRKKFKDFSYLTVDPPGWAVVLVFILTILANLGISAWAIMNEHDSTFDFGPETSSPKVTWAMRKERLCEQTRRAWRRLRCAFGAHPDPAGDVRPLQQLGGGTEKPDQGPAKGE